jgi:hypothetical protein
VDAARGAIPGNLWPPAYRRDRLILGGIPAYLEQFDDNHSLEFNVRTRVLNLTSFFLIDPLYLLNEALHEPRNYHSICSAIGLGARRPLEIAKVTGLERTNLPKYLSTLQTLGFLERRTPVDWREETGQERGIYVIKDHLFSKSGFTAALQSRAAQEWVILADLEQVANL